MSLITSRRYTPSVIHSLNFLSDPGIPGPIFVSGCPSVSETPCWDLTDVTLADEDTNSILTDNANRAIQGNVAMQVAPSGGQILQLMQVTQSGGQFVN